MDWNFAPSATTIPQCVQAQVFIAVLAFLRDGLFAKKLEALLPSFSAGQAWTALQTIHPVEFD
ncbi:hypothetical protein [Candidatus Methylacidithermus pantelleriae]|uniref:hypothetical protein n=1 Tax=Candidatus Methylacidithermus pantelleriae TaxID=2744239 RepID=UPI00157D1546|nr:hypothetical protein [Candidatus Methylacidithermus pantelleriae]